jgi:hypothetical protein
MQELAYWETLQMATLVVVSQFASFICINSSEEKEHTFYVTESI